MLRDVTVLTVPACALPIPLGVPSLWGLTANLWVDVPPGATFDGVASMAIPALNVSSSLAVSLPQGQAQAITLQVGGLLADAWWPRAWAPQGQPTLYNATLQLEAPGSGLVASRSILFGFRTVEILQVR